MLIKTKINNEQKYVKISEPSLEEFLNAGKPSVTPLRMHIVVLLAENNFHISLSGKLHFGHFQRSQQSLVLVGLVEFVSHLTGI